VLKIRVFELHRREEPLVAQDAKFTQLLETLSEHALVKAALLLDRFGRVKLRRGNALCLTDDHQDTDATVRMENSPRRESLYMKELSTYILVVIFDENIDFEDISEDVDELIRQLEL
jgi:hypothetical protein